MNPKLPESDVDKLFLNFRFGGDPTSPAKVSNESIPGWVTELRAAPSTGNTDADFLPGLLVWLGETKRRNNKYIIVQVRVDGSVFKLTCILCSCACLSTSCTLEELIRDAGQGVTEVSFTTDNALEPVVGMPFYIGRVSARQSARKGAKKPRKPSERSGSDADSETGGDTGGETGDEKDSKSLQREAAKEKQALVDAPVKKKRTLSGLDRSLLLSTSEVRGFVELLVTKMPEVDLLRLISEASGKELNRLHRKGKEKTTREDLMEIGRLKSNVDRIALDPQETECRRVVDQIRDLLRVLFPGELEGFTLGPSKEDLVTVKDIFMQGVEKCKTESNGKEFETFTIVWDLRDKGQILGDTDTSDYFERKMTAVVQSVFPFVQHSSGDLGLNTTRFGPFRVEKGSIVDIPESIRLLNEAFARSLERMNKILSDKPVTVMVKSLLIASWVSSRNRGVKADTVLQSVEELNSHEKKSKGRSGPKPYHGLTFLHLPLPEETVVIVFKSGQDDPNTWVMMPLGFLLDDKFLSGPFLHLLNVSGFIRLVTEGKAAPLRLSHAPDPNANIGVFRVNLRGRGCKPTNGCWDMHTNVEALKTIVTSGLSRVVRKDSKVLTLADEMNEYFKLDSEITFIPLCFCGELTRTLYQATMQAMSNGMSAVVCLTTLLPNVPYAWIGYFYANQREPVRADPKEKPRSRISGELDSFLPPPREPPPSPPARRQRSRKT